MGAWGLGPFDNDDAADWAWSLEDSAGDAVLRAALRVGAETVHPDAATSQIAVAGAVVVAAGRSGDSSELPEGLGTWLNRHRDLPWPELADLARAALVNVVKDSEARDLWVESDEAEAWVDGVEELQRSLLKDLARD